MPICETVNPVFDNVFHKNSLLFDIMYRTYPFGFDELEERVGEKNKRDRVCRFCGGKNKTYRDVAHAIPEALGNTILFCNEECDDSNHTLNKVEDNFTHLMDICCAEYLIHHRGGGKSPKIYGQNFAVEPDANGQPVWYIQQEAIPKGVDTSEPFDLRLEHRYCMANEKAYKALCKMVIDLIPGQYLPHYKDTIKWICTEQLFSDNLPDARYGYLPQVIFRQPVLDICLNERGLDNTPYCTGILYIYDMVYAFTIHRC